MYAPIIDNLFCKFLSYASSERVFFNLCTSYAVKKEMHIMPRKESVFEKNMERKKIFMMLNASIPINNITKKLAAGDKSFFVKKPYVARPRNIIDVKPSIDTIELNS